MRSSQWYILSAFFIFMGLLFVQLDNISPLSCGVENTPLSVADVWCVINTEIYDPFIMLFFPLGIVLGICGYIENNSEKKTKIND